MAQLHAMINAMKITCALMFIISNHGRIVTCRSIQLEKCSDKFKVISDIMAQYYLMVTHPLKNTINFYNEKEYE